MRAPGRWGRAGRALGLCDRGAVRSLCAPCALSLSSVSRVVRSRPTPLPIRASLISESLFSLSLEALCVSL